LQAAESAHTAEHYNRLNWMIPMPTNCFIGGQGVGVEEDFKERALLVSSAGTHRTLSQADQLLPEFFTHWRLSLAFDLKSICIPCMIFM
jgi:hypothetical protein